MNFNILNNSICFTPKEYDRYVIFSATLLLQLYSTPSLMLILSLMKSHHIGLHWTMFSMMHTSSIKTDKISNRKGVEVQ